MENQKLISLSRYLQNQDREEHEAEQPWKSSEIAEVFDFSRYHARAQEKRARFTKAKGRAYSMLGVIKTLVVDYEIDMLRIAVDCDREEYVQQYGYEPEVQIQEDMRRLQNFTAALETVLDSGDANNLLEACNALRSLGVEEIVDTLNYILVSEYFGFQAIKTLLEAGRLTEEAYIEDSEALYKLWNQLAETQLPNSQTAIAQLCCEQAVAI